jgi:carboxyl-terminal processing protease
MFYRKLLILSAVLMVLLSVAVGSYLISTDAPHIYVRAQANQPAGTQELFAPFWEAWDLLHENYVDPLNDGDLAEGALNGMLKAVNVPLGGFVEPTIDKNAPTTQELFTPFWAAWTGLHDSFGDTLDDNALMEGALNGMVNSIGDPHTSYMDPESFALINEGMNGEYEGIGATVRQDENTGGLELVSIFEGSPAEQAGLQPGDEIVQVDGEDVTMLSQDEIISLVRGPADSTVLLGISRPGQPDILDVEVVRAHISVPSVESRVLDGNIGYIHLSQFEFASSQDMRTALEQMDANNLDGLILDVRGNPGGYLTTAIEVASAYIPSGTIVIERTPDRETSHPALDNAIAPDVPMVVLVDQGSASASELISGALQDHHRATIVGMPTFGKGSVQTWRALSNGGGIRITISRWYTPDGHSVSDVGITPDVEVPYVPENISGDPDNQITAAVAVLHGTYQPTIYEQDALDQMSANVQ